jgi:hypothetical protein
MKGAWAGYVMSGTLYNASGDSIDVGEANTVSTKSIYGYDIHNYNETTQTLYESIKNAEYTKETYGKGLFLVGTGECSDLNRYYNAAYVLAAKKFGGVALTGNYDIGEYAYGIRADGAVAAGCGQKWDEFVVAPAFNVDLTAITVSGSAISLRENMSN